MNDKNKEVKQCAANEKQQVQGTGPPLHESNRPGTYPRIGDWSTESNDANGPLNLRGDVAHTGADNLHNRLQ